MAIVIDRFQNFIQKYDDVTGVREWSIEVVDSIYFEGSGKFILTTRGFLNGGLNRLGTLGNDIPQKAEILFAALDASNFVDKEGVPWTVDSMRDFLLSITGGEGVLYYDNKTGFDSIFLFDNQALTTGDDNLITFAGGSEFNNGNLDLLDANGKITPIQEGDFITVDFACYYTVPSGTDNYLIVKFIVNGQIFRASTNPFKQPNGSTGYVSESFGFPVGTSLNNFGMEIFIETSVNITINNKYISAERGHKAVPTI